jgi:hypothetical protein
MRVDAYIVIELDSGKLCVTTGEPGARTILGEEFFFKDSIVSLSVPGVKLDPVSSSLSSGSSSVKVMSDITPGDILVNYNRVAGSRARIWIEDEEERVYESFDGEVASVGFGLNEDTMEFSFEPKEDISLLEYPPNNYFDNGRFVNKTTFNAVEPGGFTQLISVLEPAMEFKSPFGTPSSPISSSVVFNSLEIPVGDGTYDPGNLYLFFSDSVSDGVVPVIYGTGKNVSSAPLGYYEVTVNSTVFVRVFIYPIASHAIVGDQSLAPASGTNFRLKAKWNDVFIGNVDGYTDGDSLNGTVSYVTFFLQYTDASYEEPTRPELDGFNPDEVYFESVTGKIGADSKAIRGLGNVLFDMYQSSSQASADYIDWVLTSPSLALLNKYDADIVINAKQEGQTLQSIFRSRLEGQFPVAVGSAGGKFAIQSTEVPVNQAPVMSFEYGVSLIERTELQQTGLGEIENEVRVQYGANGASSDNSDNVLIDRFNSEIARASYDRWGQRPIVSISVPDVQSASTAGAIASERLRRRGGIRMRVSYEMEDVAVTGLPLMSVVSITDEDVGFTETRFMFLGYEWADDLTFIKASFLSVDMI